MKTSNTKNAGFSLIEVMVVVAIIGVLASIAIPGYQRYVIQTNRTAAAACLTELAQFMERTYTQNMTYAPDDIDVPALGCVNDLDARYGFEFSNLARRTYTVSAVPTGMQNDAACGTLTINQAGQKGAAGSFDNAVVNACW